MIKYNVEFLGCVFDQDSRDISVDFWMFSYNPLYKGGLSPKNLENLSNLYTQG